MLTFKHAPAPSIAGLRCHSRETKGIQLLGAAMRSACCSEGVRCRSVTRLLRIRLHPHELTVAQRLLYRASSCRFATVQDVEEVGIMKQWRAASCFLYTHVAALLCICPMVGTLPNA